MNIPVTNLRLNQEPTRFEVQEPRFKKIVLVNPELVESIMNPPAIGDRPGFPPRAEENNRMQNRLGGPRP